MAIREVLKMGDPSLYQISKEVEDVSAPEIRDLVRDMQDTMQAMNGAGLAAPQIGVPLRVVIFGVQENPRYPNAETVPETILINPVIEVLTDEKTGLWEGCLSVPGMRGYVERPNKIRYRGVDLNNNAIKREAEGFHAVVVQHECDHLDGILYPMRMNDLRLFGFEEKLPTV